MRRLLARAGLGRRPHRRRPADGLLFDDRGSAPVEFVLVGVLLTVLTLAVLQLGLAVYVRNVVHDAAVEGAYHAALADTTLAEGEQRVRAIAARAVGRGFVTDVAAQVSTAASGEAVEMVVRARLPMLGLFGIPGGLEVIGRAPLESFD